ncbi:MAG: ABC transporter substrate-binding protein [Methanomicrobiales archaeon]|nr:ABC transporter substrate-binding protein [Methanomicrobiales archaeon]NYT21061.1 ABC transporter substrate-binding protein [Methanomicrobiales archaeon]
MDRNIIFIGILLAGLLFAGCSQPEAGDELKIGVVASMTGPASTTGKDIWQSAVIAAEEINADGGVYVKDLGKSIPVTVILGDDESTREGGQKAVTRLITEDKVDALVGGFSSAVVSAHESIVSENGVPYIVTGASSPVITHRTDVDTSSIFHHCPTTDDYGRQTTLFASEIIRPAINEQFGFPDNRPLRLALLVQDSPYGKGVESAVLATVQTENLPIIIVANETFKMGETDFRTVLTSIKAAGPDVVYPAAFLNEQIPMIIQARRDVGMNAIFLAVECNDDPDYYSGIGQYGEYSIIESRFSPYVIPPGPLSPDIAAFKDSFNTRWGGFPGMMGASTYEGVYIIKQAVENAGTRDKPAVIDALKTLNMPEIIEAMQGGAITFTPDFRESKFELYMEQLLWNETEQAVRPVIVWPASLQQQPFGLPDWFEPGGA